VKARLKATSTQFRREGSALADRLDKASPHWLRHTFAKAALLQGQSMREVAGLLGHASMDTTMVGSVALLSAGRRFSSPA